MKSLVISLNMIVARKDSKIIIITTSLLFVILLLLVHNGQTAAEILTFTSLSFFRRTVLFLVTLFDMPSSFMGGTFVLALLGSLLGGFNTALAYTYVRILHSSLYRGPSPVMAFIGAGSAACGTAFISLLLGFFGISAMISLSYQEQDVGYIGLIFLSIASYTLAQKVAAPNVC